MSSFGRDISTLIHHSLADFAIFRASDDGIGYLCPDAKWLLEYALSKGQGTRLPKRRDLSPADMTDVLPDVLILEPVIGEGNNLDDITVRLVGSNISSFYGQVTGQSLRKLSDSAAAKRGFDCVAASIATREPIVGVSHRLNDKISYFAVTVLAIPLVNDEGDISQVFVHVDIGPEETLEM
ncbi:MAG: PAS domain-containing protein [Alphaproteobacteria bacterium]|nr:PAS domain-containing protein [Alphaproteobacteria bacterium]